MAKELFKILTNYFFFRAIIFQTKQNADKEFWSHLHTYFFFGKNSLLYTLTLQSLIWKKNTLIYSVTELIYLFFFSKKSIYLCEHMPRWNSLKTTIYIRSLDCVYKSLVMVSEKILKFESALFVIFHSKSKLWDLFITTRFVIAFRFFFHFLLQYQF